MMRKRGDRPLSGYLSCFALCLTVLVCGCNPRETGCLDADATNFDFGADQHDPEMCAYPNMYLSVLYNWGDTSFVPGEFYQNDLGQHLAVHGVQVLLSQFVMVTVDGAQFGIESLIDWYLKTPDGTELLEVPDDFIFADRSRFDFSMGEVRQSDPLSQYTFYLGVSESLTPVCLDSLPVSHPLRSSKSMYNHETGQFATARFDISRDTTAASRDTLWIFRQPELCSFLISKDLVQGRNDTLSITLDFHEMFRSVDLDVDSAQIVTELASSLKSGIFDRN